MVKPGSCSRRCAYSTRAAERKCRGDGNPTRVNHRSQVRRSTRARTATWPTVWTSPGERSASSSTQRSSLGNGASASLHPAQFARQRRERVAQLVEELPRRGARFLLTEHLSQPARVIVV